MALRASVAIWPLAVANLSNFSLSVALRQPKKCVWMTHVSMLPAKTLFIMLPWGHTEMMICFSNKSGHGIEGFSGHWALGGGQFV